MPKIETWGNLPPGVRQHLIERMTDRAISIADLNDLRLWIDSAPEVPEGDWYRDFGTFKICGSGSLPKTFLLTRTSSEGHGGLAQAADTQFLWSPNEVVGDHDPKSHSRKFDRSAR